MTENCDVLVAGGGVAGTLAAVAAARCGARTILVEKEKILGGTGTLGLLQYICGLYLNGGTIPTETLNHGLADEIISILNKFSPQLSVRKIGKVFVLPYLISDLKYALNSLCQQEANLTVLLDTAAVSVVKENGNIVEVAVHYSGRVQKISPKVVIDCTGNGDISAMAGADFELSPPDEIQLAGYNILIKGICAQDGMLPVKVPYYLAQAVKEGVLPPSFRFSTYSPGTVPDEGYLKLSVVNVPPHPDPLPICSSPINWGTAAPINRGTTTLGRGQGEGDAVKAHQYLAGRLSPFRDSYIAETSAGVMEREGRRICGEYTLSEEDVLTGRKFPDGVVKNSWPVEIWDKNKGPVYKYIKSPLPPFEKGGVGGDYYEIPFRCLKVKGISNLLCAGRCISVSHAALGSTRVMGICMALGEQAGYAAAHRAKNGSYPNEYPFS